MYCFEWYVRKYAFFTFFQTITKKKNHQKFVTEYGHVFIFIHTYGGVCVCGRICIYKNKSYNFCSKKRLIKSFAIVHMLVDKILSLTEFELCVRIRWWTDISVCQRSCPKWWVTVFIIICFISIYRKTTSFCLS